MTTGSSQADMLVGACICLLLYTCAYIVHIHVCILFTRSWEWVASYLLSGNSMQKRLGKYWRKLHVEVYVCACTCMTYVCCLNSIVCSWTMIGIACASWSREYIVHTSLVLSRMYMSILHVNQCMHVHLQCTCTWFTLSFSSTRLSQFNSQSVSQLFIVFWLITSMCSTYKTLDKGQ